MCAWLSVRVPTRFMYRVHQVRGAGLLLRGAKDKRHRADAHRLEANEAHIHACGGTTPQLQERHAALG